MDSFEFQYFFVSHYRAILMMSFLTIWAKVSRHEICFTFICKSQIFYEIHKQAAAVEVDCEPEKKILWPPAKAGNNTFAGRR